MQEYRSPGQLQAIKDGKKILILDLGLDFISKLNPVLIHRINDENQKIEYGLIAQELEEVLKEVGVVKLQC